MNEEESTFLGNRTDEQLNSRPSVDEGDTRIQDIENGPSNTGQMARLKTFLIKAFYSYHCIVLFNFRVIVSRSGAGQKKKTVACECILYLAVGENRSVVYPSSKRSSLTWFGNCAPFSWVFMVFLGFVSLSIVSRNIEDAALLPGFYIAPVLVLYFSYWRKLKSEIPLDLVIKNFACGFVPVASNSFIQ